MLQYVSFMSCKTQSFFLLTGIFLLPYGYFQYPSLVTLCRIIPTKEFKWYTYVWLFKYFQLAIIYSINFSKKSTRVFNIKRWFQFLIFRNNVFNFFLKFILLLYVPFPLRSLASIRGILIFDIRVYILVSGRTVEPGS